MTGSVMTFEETLTGERIAGATLNFPTTRVALRDLIRARVYEETRAHNRRVQEYAEALKEQTGRHPLMSETEVRLNASGNGAGKRMVGGVKLKELDWEQQAELALAAFQRNRFFVIVGDRQVEDLDAEIELTVGAEVTFLKLIPLAGG